MDNKIGALAAVAFVLSTQGVTAASISEVRLQELMSSTSIQEVSLETLRARDRNILEELARSLATRYSDVLAGSEMVFTRLSESGSLFYRLDFVGLKNKDHARALCEVLEMDRCIAKIGDDRLTVLEVKTDPIVSAIAIVEEDTDAAPFDWIDEDPAPVENPKAREIEAHVRDMLDPLRVFPEPRPEFDLPASQEVAAASPEAISTDAAAPETAPAAQDAVPAVPKDEARKTEEADTTKETASAMAPKVSLYPIARPFKDVAELEHHPEPFARPMDRLAELTAPEAPTRVALYPLARPFGAQFAEAVTKSADAPGSAVKEVAPSEFALYPLARPFGAQMAETVAEPVDAPVLASADTDVKPSVSSAPISMPRAPMGGFMGGYIEVADVGVMPVATPASKTPVDTVVRIPGIGKVDLSKINAMAPQMETARAVLPGISPMKAKGAGSVARVASAGVKVVTPEAVAKVEAPVTEVVVTKVAEAAPRILPTPVDRSFALGEVEKRQAAAAVARALAAGQNAPQPLLRQAALMEIVPAPQAMTTMASLSASLPQTDLSMDIPATLEAPERLTEVTRLEGAADLVDIAMATPENPEQPVRMVAEKAPKPVPRRLNIQMPPVQQVAEATPEKIAPVKPAPGFKVVEDKRSTMAALAVAQASSRASRLGSVSFDDRYARPASVDFSQGRVAGRLQKLPFYRPDLSGYVKASAASATPLREPGAPDGVAMLSDRNAPFEIAQIPGSMMEPKEDTTDASQPFVLEEKPDRSEAPGDLLDKLLAGNSENVAAPSATTESLADFMPKRKSSLNKASTAKEAEDIFGTDTEQNTAPVRSSSTKEMPRPAMATSTARPGLSGAKSDQDITAPQTRLQLTPEMRVTESKPTAKPTAVLPTPPAKAEASSGAAAPKASVTFEAPEKDQSAYEARQLEDDAAKQRRALETLSQIVQERQSAQQAPEAEMYVEEAPQPTTAPSARRQVFPATEGSMQRRPAPRGVLHGNSDIAAAQELARHEASFSDDRTRMERAAHPRGVVSPAERMQRHNSLSQSVAPADLRIELSYVGSREQVSRRVGELKSFFPPVMMTKGRFFGASVPGQSNQFVVGFAATDLSTRDDIIWYLEQMGLPWAIR